MAEIVFCREAFRVPLNALFRDIDLVIMPATNAAAPTVADMAPDRRTSEAVQARIRLTAPFNMSGHPTLTLPGGKTDDGLPVGFQIVGRHMEEALILRAGYAFQQMTYWHRRRPPFDWPPPLHKSTQADRATAAPELANVRSLPHCGRLPMSSRIAAWGSMTTLPPSTLMSACEDSHREAARPLPAPRLPVSSAHFAAKWKHLAPQKCGYDK